MTKFAAETTNVELSMTAFAIRPMKFDKYTIFFTILSINDLEVAEKELSTPSYLAVSILSKSLFIVSFTWN